MMEQFKRNLRQAFRVSYKHPGFTLIVVLTLALGIGANTTMFSLVEAVLLRPLPYANADQIVQIWERSPTDSQKDRPVSAPNFIDWRTQNNVFQQVAALDLNDVNLSDGQSPERIGLSTVSPEFFPLMGVQPAVGSFFQYKEGESGDPHVLIVSNALWKRKFGGSSSIIGQTLRLDGVSYTVMGVMPAGFAFPTGADMWGPLEFGAAARPEERGAHGFWAVGRLKPNVSLEQAQTEMNIIANRLAESMGQSFVVENVGGGGGSIGADQVAKAAPDGHALLFHNITFSTTTSSLLFAKRARHDFDDFVPVSVGAYVPLLLLANNSVPANDLKEFVAFAKTTTTPLFYGSTGPGSILHLMGEVLKRDAGIKMDHVPYRGAAPLVTDLIAGRVQFGGDQLSSSLERVRSGQMKALGVATKSVALPNVPTVRELGFPNLELQGWNGFLAPKGTPEPVVARLQQEIAAAVKHPDVQKRMTDVGAEPSGSTQAEMREMLRRQVAQIRPVVEELKLLVE